LLRAAPHPLPRLEKITANLAIGDETGPLEATIRNLQREIDKKVRSQGAPACYPCWVEARGAVRGLQLDLGAAAAVCCGRCMGNRCAGVGGMNEG